MANNYFRFKKFTIYQDKAAMKVGTDGVLVGAWADVNKAERILDVGCGTGLIAIMLAQRTNDYCTIDGVEIDSLAYQQAVDNVKACLWSSRIELFNQSFQTFVKDRVRGYDMIVSNPPFFLNGIKTSNGSRTLARHADNLPFEELLEGARTLLNPGGRLAVILPVMEGEQFIRLAEIMGFSLSKHISVLPNPGKAPRRYLLEFSMDEGPLLKDELVVENGIRHVYSPQYIALTKEFYLNF